MGRSMTGKVSKTIMSIRQQRSIRIQFEIPAWVEWLVVLPVLLYRRIRYGYTFRRIRLTQGKFAIVDSEDYARLIRYKWCAVKCYNTFYAVRKNRGKNARGNIRMHRVIIGVDKGYSVDHINHNGIDNRRSNLRAATHAENLRNTLRRCSNESSRYRGVCWNKTNKKWRSNITVNFEQKHLGYFSDEISAAKAYDAAAKKYHCEFAVLNFP